MELVLIVKVEVADTVSDCEISRVNVGCSFEMTPPSVN